MRRALTHYPVAQIDFNERTSRLIRRERCRRGWLVKDLAKHAGISVRQAQRVQQIKSNVGFPLMRVCLRLFGFDFRVVGIDKLKDNKRVDAVREKWTHGELPDYAEVGTLLNEIDALRTRLAVVDGSGAVTKGATTRVRGRTRSGR